jgi:hypothetical protein
VRRAQFSGKAVDGVSLLPHVQILGVKVYMLNTSILVDVILLIIGAPAFTQSIGDGGS